MKKSIKQILLLVFFVIAAIIIYPAVVLVWNDSANSYPDAPPIPIGSMLIKLAIIIALAGFGKKALEKKPIDKLDTAQQLNLMKEIDALALKATKESQKQYPGMDDRSIDNAYEYYTRFFQQYARETILRYGFSKDEIPGIMQQYYKYSMSK